jgi:cellulose synthase (UDP-forming)
MLLAGPLLYWYFDVPTLYGEPMQFLAYGVPALLVYWAYSIWVTGSRALPIFTEVTQIVSALAVTATLTSAFFKPFGRPFKVTNKGLDRSRLVVHGKFATLYGCLILLCGMGLARAVVADAAASGLVFNIAWTAVSMVLYLTSLLVCVELPRPRKEERFAYRERALLRIHGKAACAGNEYTATTVNLSCNGVAITSALAASVPVGAEGAVWMQATGWVPCRIARRQGNLLGLALHLDMATRHRLIRLLFSEPGHNVARQGNPRLAISRLMWRAFSG